MKRTGTSRHNYRLSTLNMELHNDKNGCVGIIKTHIPSTLTKELGVFLHEYGFISYYMLVTRDLMHIVLVFADHQDVTVFELKDLERVFINLWVPQDYQFSSAGFEKELTEKFGIYDETEEYYYIHR